MACKRSSSAVVFTENRDNERLVVALESPLREKKTAPSEELFGRVRLRIAVAAEPALFRELLSRQLEMDSSFIVVAQASGRYEIVEDLVSEKPSVLVIDYEGLGPDAESTIHRLRRVAPDTRVLVLAIRSDQDMVQSILRAGASGLVGKELDFSVLVRAIRAVAAGEIWANRRATSLLVENLAMETAVSRSSELTRREQDIADACARGLRNKEIARLLNISEKTVKGHLNNVFRKLRVDNRLALCLRVFKGGSPASPASGNE